MPRRDGTGPMGAGTMTGHGLGFCTGKNAVKRGAGLGLGLGFACRRGFGSGFGRGLAINQCLCHSFKSCHSKLSYESFVSIPISEIICISKFGR